MGTQKKLIEMIRKQAELSRLSEQTAQAIKSKATAKYHPETKKV